MSKISDLLLSGGAQAALAYLRGYSANDKDSNYFSGAYPLINLVAGNGVEGFDSPGIYQDALGWLRSVPSGTGLAYDRRIVAGANYFPPGTYRVTNTGGMYCTISGGGASFFHATQQGIDSGTQSLRDAIFTIDDLGTTGDYSALSLTITVHARATGGPFDCADLYCGLDSSYALWQAGQICDPAWLASFAGVSAGKFADQVGMNTAVNYTTTAAQLISPLRSYQGSGYASYGTMAKVCKELKCMNWVICPFGYESGGFSCAISGNTVTATLLSGMPFISTWAVNQQVAVWGGGFQDGANHFGLTGYTIYYVKSVVSSSPTVNVYTLSLTPGGAAVTISGNFAGGDYSYQIATLVDPYPMCLKIFQDTIAANPTGKICPQIGLENWNNQYYYLQNRMLKSLFTSSPGDVGKGYAWNTMQMWKAARDAGYPRSQMVYLMDSWGISFSTLSSAFDYVSVDPTFNLGKSVSSLMDCVSVAAYPHHQDGALNDIPMLKLISLGAINFTPAQWSVYTRNGIDGYHAQAQAWRSELDLKRPNTPAIMYEGGLNEDMQYGQDGNLTKTCTISIASPGVITTSAYAYGTYPDNYAVSFTTTGALPTGLVVGTVYYIVAGSGTSTTFRVSATIGGAAINTSGTQSGTHTMSLEGPQITALATSYQNYCFSSQYALDFKYFLDTVCCGTGYKSRNLAVYAQSSGWASTQHSFSFWGMKRAAQLPDTPALTLLKTYTGWNTSP